MKSTLRYSSALFIGAALFYTSAPAEARDYGISSSSAGRGTKYTSERGGTAYVGPRGVAAEGSRGNRAAVSRSGGAVYSGPNSSGVINRYGGATAVTSSGDVYRRSPNTATVTTRRVTTLPNGYVRVVPAGYRTVVYRGYNCRYVGGVYYRPVMYQGTTVYVVVN